jgi:hypothetical protein
LKTWPNGHPILVIVCFIIKNSLSDPVSEETIHQCFTVPMHCKGLKVFQIFEISEHDFLILLLFCDWNFLPVALGAGALSELGSLVSERWLAIHKVWVHLVELGEPFPFYILY